MGNNAPKVGKPEVYVSVDIESDGPSVLTNSMISIGAVVIDKPDQTFYAELKPIHDDYVPEALAVSGLDRNWLLKNGREAGEAMNEFALWLEALPGRPVFCSFSTWDWSYVYPYLMHFAGRSPFSHSSLDLKSFYMGKYGTRWNQAVKREIARSRPYLVAGAGPHTHNALDDAKEQGVLFGRMLTDRIKP